jgi:hypothetical protein
MDRSKRDEARQSDDLKPSLTRNAGGGDNGMAGRKKAKKKAAKSAGKKAKKKGKRS